MMKIGESQNPQDYSEEGQQYEDHNHEDQQETEDDQEEDFDEEPQLDLIIPDGVEGSPTEGKPDSTNRLMRENKFKIESNNLIYSENLIEKARGFIKAYRYVLNLKHSIEKDFEQKKRIQTLLDSLSDAYQAITVLLDKYDYGRNFGRGAIRNKIAEYISSSSKRINELEDLVLPLGKKIEFFDPDKEIGYY